MTSGKNLSSLHPILDDIAVDALTKPLEQVEAELIDAGIDIQAGVSRFRRVTASIVSEYHDQQYRELPSSVPEDVGSINSILDQLLAMPQVRESNMMMAFRDLEELSDSDKRQLAISLLELLKEDH